MSVRINPELRDRISDAIIEQIDDEAYVPLPDGSSIPVLQAGQIVARENGEFVGFVDARAQVRPAGVVEFMEKSAKEIDSIIERATSERRPFPEAREEVGMGTVLRRWLQRPLRWAWMRRMEAWVLGLVERAPTDEPVVCPPPRTIPLSPPVTQCRGPAG